MERQGPLFVNTPLEDHLASFGLLVKREDLSCPAPGPPFSKTRGVFAHVEKKVREGINLFGVLDTYHSQAGHAVAAACRVLGVTCVNFFPVYKADRDAQPGDFIINLQPTGHIKLRPPQQQSLALGAQLHGLQAGRSAVLFHTAKRLTEEQGGYMMPNALKLPETVDETAREVVRTWENADRHTYHKLTTLPWLVSASSGTIAAGVLRGLHMVREKPPRLIVHMGYERSLEEVVKYIGAKSNCPTTDVQLVTEGYAYADQAKPGAVPAWPCNPWYDLKAFRWWMRRRERADDVASPEEADTEAVLWNIG